MEIIEKLQYSSDKSRFTLFKEGLFYKCHNEDAMVFAKRHKPYRISTKYVKNVASIIMSLGFPISAVKHCNLFHSTITLGSLKIIITKLSLCLE